MDKLEQIFKMQNAFIHLLIPKCMCRGSYEDEIKLQAIALADEAFEILHETNWKLWKRKKPINEERIKEEIIDAFHFIVNMAIISGMTAEDFTNEYYRKNAINIQRQKENY